MRIGTWMAAGSISALLTLGWVGCAIEPAPSDETAADSAELGSCGGELQQCCSYPLCEPGLNCVGTVGGYGVRGLCMSCGGTGEACCDSIHTEKCTGGNVCHNRSVYSDGVCAPPAAAPCGGPFEPCCDREICDSGLQCKGRDGIYTGGPGVCTPCGGNGQECCKGSTKCGSGLSCDRDLNVCRADACGGVGEWCCPGASCGAGATCCGNGRCVPAGTACTPCGMIGGPCCYSSTGYAYCQGGVGCWQAPGGGLCTQIINW